MSVYERIDLTYHKNWPAKPQLFSEALDRPERAGVDFGHWPFHFDH